MSDTIIPPAFGPGSQPEEGEKLEYMEMPREMAVFDRPIAPEPEDTVGMEQGKARLEEVLDALKYYQPDEPPAIISLSDLPEQDLGLVNQLLGEGEVSIVSGGTLQAQESVLAGVWRVLHFSESGKLQKDTIEIADYPGAIRENVFAQSRSAVAPLDKQFPMGVFNAPSLISEITDKQASYKTGDPVHSINFTLLPQTEEDLAYISEKLGKGNTVILSRGYGNCRVSSTNTKNVWWVQYYNSQDAIILNSLEVIDVPEVIRAAPEDIEDSAERLDEILEIYR